MRSFFAEGDLLSAEIYNFFADGSCSLHTRNFKYGKLRNGTLVDVPAELVKRSKSHFITLPCGVDVVLGLNGYIWISKHVYISPDIANQPEGLYSNQNDEISISERETIARVSNLIKALAAQKAMIDETILVFMLEVASDYKTTDLLKDEIRKEVVELALGKVEMM
jgi:exosome complex component RRP4